jgi:hypothetical protein
MFMSRSVVQYFLIISLLTEAATVVLRRYLLTFFASPYRICTSGSTYILLAYLLTTTDILPYWIKSGNNSF